MASIIARMSSSTLREETYILHELTKGGVGCEQSLVERLNDDGARLGLTQDVIL